MGLNEAASDRRRRTQRDLLAEHGANRELRRVDVSRRPQAGPGAHRAAEDRVVAECADDRPRVRIEVEQPPAASDRVREVVGIGEQEPGADPTGARPQLDQGRAAGEPHAAAVGPADDLLDARHSAAGEELEQGTRLDRGAVRQGYGSLEVHVKDETTGARDL